MDSHDHQAAPEWAQARAALLELAPPPQVEQALLRALARRRRPLPWYRRWLGADPASWAAVGALTCMLALATLGVLRPPDGPRPPVLAAAANSFVPLASRQRIEQSPDAQLLRRELPRSTLVALGIPIADDAPDELIRADLLVPADGEPLAIRLYL